MSQIMVYCRLKPLEDGGINGVEYNQSHGSTQISIKNKELQENNFAFDHVFDTKEDQESVFNKIKPIITDAINGYNATIFTYGQTGSGKTYTMFGSSNKDEGIISRSILYILSYAENSSHSRKIDISLSCLELYQEKLIDLLRSSPQNQPISSYNENHLRIRQLPKGGVWIEGLEEKKIESQADFAEKIALALRRRVTASHSMNSESSRSHMCCMLTIHNHNIISNDKLSSKLYLIDLAGSEMVRKTSANGNTLNEAKYINKSLSALGNVINALSIQHGAAIVSESKNEASVKHIPYRDSKLTRILQDSLSGNSKTVLILTISTNCSQVQETVNTLRFGERTKKLKTAPKVNKEMNEDSVRKSLIEAEKQLSVLSLTIVELQNLLHQKDSEITQLKNCNMTQQHIPAQIQSLYCIKCSKNDAEVLEPSSIQPVTALSSNQVSKGPNDNGKIHHPVENAGDEEEDDVVRCAVCGLNEVETEILWKDTKEYLGTFFTCDGNCGNKFHVKCAGEIGEGGQYVIPEGEWFCTMCTIGVERDNMNTLTKSAMISIDFPEPLADGELDINNINRLYAEYHAMRRERNRVLNQWQHEKRLAAIAERHRYEVERSRDEELVAARTRIQQLEDDLLREQNEANRLRLFNDELLLKSNISPRVNNPPIEIARDPMLTRANSSPQSLQKQDSFQKLKQNDSILLTKTLSSHPTLAKMKLSVSGILPGTLIEEGNRHNIPKPWMKLDSKKSISPRASNISLSPIRGSKKCETLKKSPSHLAGTAEIESDDGKNLPLAKLEVPQLSIDLSRSTEMNDLMSSYAKSPLDKAAMTMQPASSSQHKLRNLLNSLQEERGSFAEIRQKYSNRVQSSRQLTRGNKASDY